MARAIQTYLRNSNERNHREHRSKKGRQALKKKDIDNARKRKLAIEKLRTTEINDD